MVISQQHEAILQPADGIWRLTAAIFQLPDAIWRLEEAIFQPAKGIRQTTDAICGLTIVFGWPADAIFVGALPVPAADDSFLASQIKAVPIIGSSVNICAARRNAGFQAESPATSALFSFHPCPSALTVVGNQD